MHSDFERCLANVIVSEGGYSNDAHDPGGATMNGITQAEYDEWRVAHKLPKRWVRYISIPERDSIYETEYWDKIGGDNLPVGLDYCVFDEAVNSGVARALHALRSMDANIPLDQEIKHFNDVRIAFLRGLRTWRYFGTGWSARVLKVEEIAERMVAEARKAEQEKAGTVAAVPAPIPNVPIEVSASALSPLGNNGQAPLPAGQTA